MIKNNKIKRVSIALVFIMLFQIFSNLFTVAAASIGESKYLSRGSKSDYIVQYNNGSYWVYISSNIVTYQDETETNRVAYCVIPGVPGIEWVNNNSAGYSVNLTKTLDDVRVWRVIRFGYPYVSATSLGVENDDDAYLATKLAIQYVLQNRSLSEIRTFYRGGQDPVAGMNLADITRRGNKVVDAVYNLVNKGYNGTETPLSNNIVSVNKVGDFKQDSNSNYYSQTYSVSSQVDMSIYTITNLNNFPEGSFSADLNGNAKSTFSSGEQFKVMIPKNKITGQINGEVELKTKCKTYPILYGEGPSGWQDYAVCVDPYGDVNAKGTLNAVANNGEIVINKIDGDTSKPVEGVTFELTSADGTKVGRVTTDRNGKAIFSSLFAGNYKLKEISANQNYVINNTVFDVKVEMGKTTTVDIPNYMKKGKIKVIKIDLDNKEVKIPNVEFKIYNEAGKVVDTLKTNSNGEATSIDLPINESYKVQESKTGEWYVLNEVPQTAVLKQDQITTLTFTNEKKKGQIKVIKVDADYNEVKLKDVEFKIYDEKGKEIETLKTDVNGEATSKKLPIDQNYTVKETKTQSTYILNETPETVILKENQITNITFKNKKKEGNLKLFKVDSDNHKITIGGVEFYLYSNEFKKIIGTYTTNADGEISVKNLRVGKYSWIEKVTNIFYNLADDTNVEVKWKDTTETTIENELKKGQVKIIKVDKDNNDVKLANVKFEVLDEKGNFLETLITDKNGEAITSKYAIRDYEKLVIREIETHENYVLNKNPKTIVLEENQIKTIKFENERIRGNIEITKVSSNDNKLTGDVKGTKLENAKFEIYNDKDELVDTITTGKDGKATSKLLEYGKYYIKEKNTGSDYYLLNTEKYNVEITENLKTIPVKIENESVDISLDIDKIGIVQAQANDEIKYNFNSLKNTSNVALDNFTWTDNLPYNYVRITKLFTGTYNEDLDYIVKYKTNKSDEYIEFGKYNTQKNNCIDFTKVELAEDEYITDFKVEFGTVMPGFEAEKKTFIFCKVLPIVKIEDKWTNHTSLIGNYKEHKLEDKAEWTTKSYAKKLTIKKLPKTGF